MRENDYRYVRIRALSATVLGYKSAQFTNETAGIAFATTKQDRCSINVTYGDEIQLDDKVRLH